MASGRPLEGLRVVEMSHMVMGPSAGMFLAFLGAEVIKIEPPDGDKTRNLTGMGAGFFPTFNRGKKSVTLDIKDENDLARLHALLKTADVFVENFRDETLAKMGLAPEQLRQKNPRLIVASCKGFLKGPKDIAGKSKIAKTRAVAEEYTIAPNETGANGKSHVAS